ncbi:Major facilitator superfamily domain-containing protein 6 [Seminavis robusta]|uniref:Major facilitator superfamily domain-containing protein 6 n=1 Tax=Seminavis robusta TaxID=568900 RepID=A0A9N8ETP8_9STRA|nr:Major facilitator superfamily domain-containing protein 6 [Seminavis robusta]|eukprot:Sro1601_g285130.1 Major facilitator superfamily domain-containing protein 6 (504) ;mRNA; r:5382-6893
MSVDLSDEPCQNGSDDQALSSLVLEEAVAQNQQLCEPLLSGQDNSSSAQAEEQPAPPLPSFQGLLFYRLLYFLDGLSASAWGRFGIIYYNRIKHLSAGQIGVLQGVAPVLRLVSQPVWGYIADYVQSRKTIFVICNTCCTMLILSLSHWKGFWPILCCVAAMSCFNSDGVLDAHTLDFLGEAYRGMYGSIRLWTAISWGLGAVVMGWITDQWGFHWNFVLFGTMMLLMLAAIIFGLPTRSKSEQQLYNQLNTSSNNQQEQTEEEANITAHSSSNHPQLSELRKAILRLPVCLWLAEVAIIGAGMTIVDSFLFVYLQNELDTSTELCGYTVGVTVLLELPIFHFSEYLLSKLGHDVLFLLSMFAYSTRVIGYTFLTPSTAHWVLVLEFSHGITFACMWISSIDYAAVVAPKEWSTTVQTLLSTALSCVGGGLGPVFAGLVMDRFGPYVMFRSIGVVVAALFVVHAFVYFTLKQGHDRFLQQFKAERLSVTEPQATAGHDNETSS